MTTTVCPKCGSRNFQITDYFVTGYIYEVKGGVVFADGADDGGDHVRTNCVCRDCGHQWHPRNFVYEIDDNF